MTRIENKGEVGLADPVVAEADPRPSGRGTNRVLQRAAAAFDRGDRYLQVQQPIQLNAATTAADLCRTGGRIERDTDLLGALTEIGWELEHVAYIPVEPSSARPNPTAPLTPSVIGIYLLRADHRPRPYPRELTG